MPEAAPEAAALPPTLTVVGSKQRFLGCLGVLVCVSGKLYARISSCQFCYCSKFCPLQDTGSRPAWKIGWQRQAEFQFLPGARG